MMNVHVGMESSAINTLVHSAEAEMGGNLEWKDGVVGVVCTVATHPISLEGHAGIHLDCFLVGQLP
jgi:hypothetical protein